VSAPRPSMIRRVLTGVGTALAVLAGVVAVSAVSAESARGDGGPKKSDVSNMDLDLLRESLLKIWIVEFTSVNYNQSRIAQFSWDGLNPVPPSGNPELDKQNQEGRVKLAKTLRHYLLLDLDGAIEGVDICSRVLGTKATVDPSVVAARRVLGQELPDISWNNLLLQDALNDLSAKTGVPIELHPTIPSFLTLEISFQAPAGFTVQGVLEYIKTLHEIEWKVIDGKLDVTYLGEIPKNPYRR